MEGLIYYAVDLSLGKYFVSPIEEFSKDHHHIVEIQNVSSYNGNGKDQMKIYTNGQLEEIFVGDWKVSPIVEMPFDWSGYCDIIRACDSEGSTENIVITPCSLTGPKRNNSSYSIDVTGVINFIYSLDKYKDLQHYKLLKQIEKVSQEVKKDNYPEYTARPEEIIYRLQKLVDMYKTLIQTLENHSYEGVYADTIMGQLGKIQDKLPQLPSARLDLDKVSQLLNK